MLTISSPAQCLLLLLDGAPRGGEDGVLLLAGVLGSLVSLLLLHGRLQPRLADLLGRVRSTDPAQPRLRWRLECSGGNVTVILGTYIAPK